MRDQAGNYIPNQQSYESEGVLKTGNVFLFDSTPVNLVSNLLITGSLSSYAINNSIKRADGMMADMPISKELASQSAKAKKGGVMSFFFADNLKGQDLERKMFTHSGLLKNTGSLNPFTSMRSMGAKAFAGAGALWGSKAGSHSQMKFLNSIGAPSAKGLGASIAASGGGPLTKELSTKIKRSAMAHFGKGAVGLGLNVAARALAFQEIMLPGQVLGVAAFGMDFGGIFQSIGHAETKKRQSGLSLPTMTQGFHDNRGAATMRQRAISAIHNTQSSLSQVFGKEAIHAHR